VIVRLDDDFHCSGAFAQAPALLVRLDAEYCSGGLRWSRTQSGCQRCRQTIITASVCFQAVSGGLRLPKGFEENSHGTNSTGKKHRLKSNAAIENTKSFKVATAPLMRSFRIAIERSKPRAGRYSPISNAVRNRPGLQPLHRKFSVEQAVYEINDQHRGPVWSPRLRLRFCTGSTYDG
jgi:hypothetical protein